MGFTVSGGWLLVAVVWGVVLMVVAERHRRPRPLAYSDVSALIVEYRSLRMRWIRLPKILRGAAFGLMLLALADPTLLLPSTSLPPDISAANPNPPPELLELPTKGAGIYLVLDCSGSMKNQLVAGSQRLTRLDSLKRLTRRFVQARSNDMIGLVTFARTARIVAPLTLDHSLILEKLEKLHPVRARTEDGTAIGYALFKTASLIAATKHFAQARGPKERAAYTIASTAIVLVTDGIQNPNALDAAHELRTMSIARAAETAKRESIRVYIINIEPMISQPQWRHARTDMEEAATSTGGRFYLATNEHQLNAIYQEIDELEQTVLPQKRKVKGFIQTRVQAGPHCDDRIRVLLAPYLVGIALTLLFVAYVLGSTWLRRVP